MSIRVYGIGPVSLKVTFHSQLYSYKTKIYLLTITKHSNLKYRCKRQNIANQKFQINVTNAT